MVKIQKGYFFRVDWKEEQIKAFSDSQVCLWVGGKPHGLSVCVGNEVGQGTYGNDQSWSS